MNNEKDTEQLVEDPLFSFYSLSISPFRPSMESDELELGVIFHDSYENRTYCIFRSKDEDLIKQKLDKALHIYKYGLPLTEEFEMSYATRTMLGYSEKLGRYYK